MKTIEEKARAYDEAVKKVKDYYEGKTKIYSDVNQTLELLFPELKESEDERIRKGIFKALSKKDARDVLISQGIEVSDALTWLEKQGKQKSSIEVKPRFNSGDWVAQKMLHSPLRIVDVSDIEYRVEDVEGNSGVPKIDFLDRNYHLWTIQDAKDGDVLATDNGNIYIFDGTFKDDKYPFAYCGFTRHKFEIYDRRLPFTHNNIYPATKEQHNLLFQKMKEAGYEWDAEKKELKKIVPIKVGDWIVENGVNRNPIQITSFEEDRGVGTKVWFSNGTGTYTEFLKGYHKWTIQDIKDGDILAEEPIDNYPSSFVAIYKKPNEEDFDSYCFVGFDGIFYEGEEGHTIEDIHPATKEQRDLLFQKMKEAGYEWDIENKELKKIAEELQLKEGKYYECIKQYHYIGAGEYWFDEGKVYFCEKDGYLRSDPYHLIKVDDCKNWQKCFHPYTEKLAWSVEDDCMINNIIDVLKPLSQTTHSDYAINSMINWVKSFKDRVQRQNHINTKCKYVVDDDLLRSAICD